MESTSLLLLAGMILLGIVLNAMRFMRFVGFLTGSRRRAYGRQPESLMSFDQRLADRLRDLESKQH